MSDTELWGEVSYGGTVADEEEPRMELPKPDRNHRRMLAFTGSWTGPETIHPTPWNPKKSEAVGAMTAEMAVDGFFVLMEYQQTQDDKVGYYGHGIVGYEPKTGEHLMWWFDNMGVNPSGASRGRWEGNTVAFVSSSPEHHGRYTYVFNDDDTIDFTIETSPDGEAWSLFVEGTYHRDAS